MKWYKWEVLGIYGGGDLILRVQEGEPEEVFEGQTLVVSDTPSENVLMEGFCLCASPSHARIIARETYENESTTR